VHHGLFWGGVQPLRGAFLRRIRLLLEHGIAVYSSHLPLDMHPELGNNTLLARELGLVPGAGFARFKTVDIGVAGTSDVSTPELVARATRFARSHGHEVRTAGTVEGKVTRRWGICTGAGAGQDTLREAATSGVDTLNVG
jgi:putative NIF3 family GTP cyclohydrolase 1 type 2